jgi:ribose transport system permease protein
MSTPQLPTAAGGSPGAFARRAQGRRRLRAQHVRDYGIVAFALAIFTFFSLASPVFLTSGNLLNVIDQNAVVGIPACAMTLTIVGGNFDLSVGAIFTLAQLLCAWTAVHWGLWWCLPMALLPGLAMGMLNGAIVTKLRVNAFLATLATSLVFSGLTFAVSGGYAITPASAGFTELGQGAVDGVPYADLVFAATAVALQAVLAYTAFGRRVYGLGANREAARLSGLRVDRVAIATFALTGAACGLAGLLDASATGGGAPTNPMGEVLPLAAIAGVALGGTSIFGGAGAVWRTVVGVLMLGTITNGFDLLGIADYWQQVIRGTLIVAAVAIGALVEHP